MGMFCRAVDSPKFSTEYKSPAKANRDHDALRQGLFQNAKTHQGGKHRVQDHHGLDLAQVVLRHGDVVAQRSKAGTADTQPPELVGNDALEKFPGPGSSASALAYRRNSGLFQDISTGE